MKEYKYIIQYFGQVVNMYRAQLHNLILYISSIDAAIALWHKIQHSIYLYKKSPLLPEVTAAMDLHKNLSRITYVR